MTNPASNAKVIDGYRDQKSLEVISHSPSAKWDANTRYFDVLQSEKTQIDYENVAKKTIAVNGAFQHAVPIQNSVWKAIFCR